MLKSQCATCPRACTPASVRPAAAIECEPGSNLPNAALNPKNQKDKKIHIKILNTTNDSYQYEYGYVGESKKKKGKAKRLN